MIDQAKGKAANFVSDDKNYKVVITDAGEAALVSKDASPYFSDARLELGSILNMRFYVTVPEGWETANDWVELTLNRMLPRSIEYKDHKSDDVGNYFACPVNAYQMADTITATYYHGEEEKDSVTYSVKEYLDKLYADAQLPDATRELAKATINYGHYIQPYLGRLNGWVPGNQYAEMPSSWEIAHEGNPAEKYKHTFTPVQDTYSAMVEKTLFYLTLDSDTLLKVRVYPKDKSMEVTGKVNGEEAVCWNESDGSWVICMRGLPANGLGIPYSFAAFVGGTKVFDLSVSALSFVNLVLSHDGILEDEQKALHALYNYAQAAEAYAPQNQNS